MFCAFPPSSLSSPQFKKFWKTPNLLKMTIRFQQKRVAATAITVLYWFFFLRYVLQVLIYAMEEDGHDFGFNVPALSPALVSLAPFSSIPSPSPRRLSTTNFARPCCPTSAPPKRMAWVSLQGRLVNAEEASSARAIGGNLSREEAVAWEFFSPIQRFLIVAVIGVAVAESKKNRIIRQLTKSVELRVSS